MNMTFFRKRILAAIVVFVITFIAFQSALENRFVNWADPEFNLARVLTSMHRIEEVIEPFKQAMKLDGAIQKLSAIRTVVCDLNNTRFLLYSSKLRINLILSMKCESIL
jgi:hypothetical protein